MAPNAVSLMHMTCQMRMSTYRNTDLHVDDAFSLSTSPLAVRFTELVQPLEYPFETQSGSTWGRLSPKWNVLCQKLHRRGTALSQFARDYKVTCAYARTSTRHSVQYVRGEKPLGTSCDECSTREGTEPSSVGQFNAWLPPGY